MKQWAINVFSIRGMSKYTVFSIQSSIPLQPLKFVKATTTTTTMMRIIIMIKIIVVIVVAVIMYIKAVALLVGHMRGKRFYWI